MLDRWLGCVGFTLINALPAWQLAERLAQRKLSAVDVARAFLDQIENRDGAVHSFAYVDPDAVMAQARVMDVGPLRGPLHGLPFGVKDLFDTADMPTAYGSPIYSGHRPAADAAAVALCKEAGALVMGKTVTTEFAYFNPGPTHNPHDLAHTPGGSSSGSAAAVADHMVPLALGTQTAGSIIRPAAYCGVVGYKPSHGRVPRAGVKSLSETLDTVGGFGRCVRDVALLGSVLTGDSSLLTAIRTFSDSGRSLRMGVCRTPEWPLADVDTQRLLEQAIRALAPQLHSFAEVELPPDMPDLVALQKQVMAFEMTRALSHERLGHRVQLSPQLRGLFDAGIRIPGADHAANLLATAQAHRSANTLFDYCDVLLAPSVTGEAPLGLDATGDPLFCRGWTLLGLPCIHLPFFKGQHGLPMGLQLVGRFGADAELLAAAQWVHERLQD